MIKKLKNLKYININNTKFDLSKVLIKDMIKTLAFSLIKLECLFIYKYQSYYKVAMVILLLCNIRNKILNYLIFQLLFMLLVIYISN